MTLGGTGNEKGAKRHPTLESNVFVGSGAKILGPITVGANSRIGANSAVLKDVPKNATVTGMRARIIKIDGKRVSECPAGINPEELWAKLLRVEEEMAMLKKEIKTLKGEKEGPVIPSHIEVEVLHKGKE